MKILIVDDKPEEIARAISALNLDNLTGEIIETAKNYLMDPQKVIAMYQEMELEIETKSQSYSALLRMNDLFAVLTDLYIPWSHASDMGPNGASVVMSAIRRKIPLVCLVTDGDGHKDAFSGSFLSSLAFDTCEKGESIVKYSSTKDWTSAWAQAICSFVHRLDK
ncbi:TPA: hypothetical protein DEP94_01085 [Candidatus Nomurabacteria bacterium]|nr:hypothetical protein [Candidatus Nomurabacteria bacterium]